MTYRAPTDDIQHALDTAAGLGDLVGRGMFEGVDSDLVKAVLGEAGRFAEEELAPLNTVGDKMGSRLENGSVTVPEGWTEAYRKWMEAGWAALPGPVEYGGQGLPNVLSMAVCEIWNSANLAFGLASLLTQGTVDVLVLEGSEELKRIYLPKLVSGEWCGTMNLTESQAGSDLGLIKTRAEPQADGSYRLFGTKIFITYGEHEMTENICHLVLARLPDAPAGTKGISLFLVPKYLVEANGSLGARNDVTCTGIEHKLGIHASPTCVMTYGDREGAVGTMVGEPNRGLKAMFIMMNAARLAVGVEGVGIAERATQAAIAYARERCQGRALGAPRDAAPSPIIAHPDVRRTLLTMQALTGAARAICLATAAAGDVAERSETEAERKHAEGRRALLTPVAKAFSTDIGVEVASLGIQVHGGMGYIEETGAAQYYRDARILPIYEGTNGIQAIDLVTRKLPLENGAVLRAYLAEMRETAVAVRAFNVTRFGAAAERLDEALTALEGASLWLGQALIKGELAAALAGATPYLRLFGLTAGGTYLAKGALAAVRSGDGAADRPVTLARFFAENLLTEAPGLARSITDGAGALAAAGSLFET